MLWILKHWKLTIFEKNTTFYQYCCETKVSTKFVELAPNRTHHETIKLLNSLLWTPFHLNCKSYIVLHTNQPTNLKFPYNTHIVTLGPKLWEKFFSFPNAVLPHNRANGRKLCVAYAKSALIRINNVCVPTNWGLISFFH